MNMLLLAIQTYVRTLQTARKRFLYPCLDKTRSIITMHDMSMGVGGGEKTWDTWNNNNVVRGADTQLDLGRRATSRASHSSSNVMCFATDTFPELVVYLYILATETIPTSGLFPGKDVESRGTCWGGRGGGGVNSSRGVYGSTADRSPARQPRSILRWVGYLAQCSNDVHEVHQLKQDACSAVI